MAKWQGPPESYECEATDEPVCPYCGSEQGDAFELPDSGETNCGECFRPFSFDRVVTCYYNTSPLMGPHRLSAIEQTWEAETFPLEETGGT